MFLTTRRGVVLDATSAAAEFLNVSFGALMGKPLLHFVARGDTGRFRSFVEDGAPDSITVKLRPRGGHPFDTRLQVRPAPHRLIWLAEPQRNRSPQATPNAATPSTSQAT